LRGTAAPLISQIYSAFQALTFQHFNINALAVQHDDDLPSNVLLLPQTWRTS
jgi:hypothetical protein